MECHEVDYEIFGDDMQIVEVELDPGEVVIAEAGAMNYMDDGITFEAKMGDGSKANSGVLNAIFDIGKRVLTGESIFMTHFENEGQAVKSALRSQHPTLAKLLLWTWRRLGRSSFVRKTHFYAPRTAQALDIAFHKKLGAGFFGGEGFILQRLRGDGKAFIHVGGTVIKRELKGETLRVDTGCIAAFTSGIDYDIEMAGGLKSMVFGGEGLFLATLQGTGTVYLQSLPFSRLGESCHTSCGFWW